MNNRNSSIRVGVAGVAAVGVAVGSAVPASAITVQQVTSSMNDVATGASNVAGVAFPVGVGIVAVSVISMVLMRFIRAGGS